MNCIAGFKDFYNEQLSRSGNALFPFELVEDFEHIVLEMSF